GFVCMWTFGCRIASARDYALTLGVALQLINIPRDIKDDLARGRVYLPLEALAAHGCTVSDLEAGIVSPKLGELHAFECRRARDFYRRAIDLRPPDERSKLVEAEITRAVYLETQKRIERNGYAVFTARVRVARPRQAAISLKQRLGSRGG